MIIQIKHPWRPMTETPNKKSNIVCAYYFKQKDGTIVFRQNNLWVNNCNLHYWGQIVLEDGVVKDDNYFMWAYQEELCLAQVMGMVKS